MTKYQRDNSNIWFRSIRDEICSVFEQIELEYTQNYVTQQIITPGKFTRKLWQREGGGGGEMSIMHGNVFEKVGVNISEVYGALAPEFAAQIPGAEQDHSFYATGISVVAHMHSPLIPAAHFNTRYIETSKKWFGGGADLTPIYYDAEEAQNFHQEFNIVCNKYDPLYYAKFKDQCDKYFYLSHRNEARGAGGIFYDYLNTNNFIKDFNFTQDVGKAFVAIYPKIIRNKMYKTWSQEERSYQLMRRGRYVEFNLLYDRGTKFGLMTGGNIEAILMSLPPLVSWN